MNKIYELMQINTLGFSYLQDREMGRINSSSQENEETTASHFSHPHPLNLISQHVTPHASCSACKLKPYGPVYLCTVCTFFLHKNCFEMPKKITHPFHKEHALTLVPTPEYGGGVFTCDACHERGSGFSYCCDPCGIDLHVLCAGSPLTLTTSVHAHKLDLTFGSPYDSKRFNCDVCRRRGYDHWLYRCKGCGFDAHLGCARGMPPCAAAPPRPMKQNCMPHPLMMGGPSAIGFPAVNGQNESVQAIVQMIHNNNAILQAMLANGCGCGGGRFGGDRGMKPVVQLMSALNRSGIGGDEIPGLDVSGGGGLDSLQSLLGGGGGGFDFLSGLFS